MNKCGSFYILVFYILNRRCQNTFIALSRYHWAMLTFVVDSKIDSFRDKREKHKKRTTISRPQTLYNRSNSGSSSINILLLSQLSWWVLHLSCQRNSYIFITFFYWLTAIWCFVVWFIWWINARQNQKPMLENRDARIVERRGTRNWILLCGFTWASNSLIHSLVFCIFQDVLLSTAHLHFLRGFCFYLHAWCAKGFNIPLWWFFWQKWHKTCRCAAV